VASFDELRDERWDWITAFPKKYCPDHFDEALQHYRPFINRFRALTLAAPDSADLLRRIMAEPDPPRIQLLRIFNRYVSPVRPPGFRLTAAGSARTMTPSPRGLPPLGNALPPRAPTGLLPVVRVMNTTSLSLLDRLKAVGPEAAEWQRLKDIYLPFIRACLAGFPGLREHADDLAQDVFVVLLRALPAFERQRHGSFRAWLRQVTAHRARAFLKANRKHAHGDGEQLLAQLEDPNSDLARRWDRDHDQHLLGKLLALVRPDFEPATWQAFTRFALDGLSAADVARELATSESAVVQAKYRVLKRLRQEAGDLMS
jgi:RNA polymerase sigma-70 factor (ECF subfamily)